MHQIDENKDSAMYNAYMGVDDIGYKHALIDDRHRYYHTQKPSYNAPKHRPYVSKRTHAESSHLPQHTVLSRTQSSPATYYKHHNNNRYRPSYPHPHYAHPHPDPYAALHPPHAPHPQPSPPHLPHPPSPYYYSTSTPYYEGPPPYGASKTYQTDPYDYYLQNQEVSHPYYTPHVASKADTSTSPHIVHIPSKAIVPSKAPKQGKSTSKSKTIIMEVPSLLSKQKQKVKDKVTMVIASPTLHLDIDTTKLDSEHDDLLCGLAEMSLKSPKMHLSRQYSEPDAKAMRDIERDLNALPLTPPFESTTIGDSDLRSLGLPTNLSYAKTTPLSFAETHHHHRHDEYGAVNDVYQAQHVQQQQQHAQPYVSYVDSALASASASFDFASFDLNEELKLIGRELADLEEEISATEDRGQLTENDLRETRVARAKVLSSVSMEKMVLEKSLDLGIDWVASSSEWCKYKSVLVREVSVLRKKNMGVSHCADVMHRDMRSQLEGKKKELVMYKAERSLNRNKNMQFELSVIELTEMVNNLKEKVDCQRHDNFLAQSKLQERQLIIASSCSCDGDDNNRDNTGAACEYPPEIVIQENLIRAQVEFYFSDYNLKRDKRLLEKICRSPRRGYLSVDEVLSLSRVRQLCNSSHHLYDALSSSLYIDMILSEEEQLLLLQEEEEEEDKDKVAEEDREEEEEEEEKVQYHPLFIGRAHFSPPTEKQFPFRRSVYIYGLPWYADDKYIYAMLNAFGGVTKVHFDHGPDTLDRCIMKKMLEKHRVYKLLSKDSAALTMEFSAQHSLQEQYHCYWCRKQKPCCDGYYHPKRVPGSAPSYRVCLQCAAAKAEEQCGKYDARSKLLKDDKRCRELLLGLPPRPHVQCKTALCVFASQRQASKCVYVRSRLAYDGAFATHYHHYSKLKKEIALSIKPAIKLLSKTHRKPNMLSVKTAPVYESQGVAVIQAHHI